MLLYFLYFFFHFLDLLFDLSELVSTRFLGECQVVFTIYAQIKVLTALLYLLFFQLLFLGLCFAISQLVFQFDDLIEIHLLFFLNFSDFLFELLLLLLQGSHCNSKLTKFFWHVLVVQATFQTDILFILDILQSVHFTL